MNGAVSYQKEPEVIRQRPRDQVCSPLQVGERRRGDHGLMVQGSWLSRLADRDAGKLQRFSELCFLPLQGRK